MLYIYAKIGSLFYVATNIRIYKKIEKQNIVTEIYNILPIFTEFIEMNLFDDKELNRIDPNFYIIPDNVKYKISKPDMPNICKDLINQLNSHECNRLIIKQLVPILKQVFDDNMACKYMLQTDSNFEQLYNDIIINKKKNFINLNTIDDFALSWCMFVYH
jgi:hypothetical protein